MYPLDGTYSVEQSARLVRSYRYATERMMRVLGGWLALTPELSAKLLMGRHVWDNAQHADLLGRRLPELRAHAQESSPGSAGVVAFMDALESPETPDRTVERLVGVYRVLKPHLVACYERQLAGANGVYEPPTRRILARCAEDERRHIAGGERVLVHLARTPEARARAEAWQARLEGLLTAAGGITGEGMPAPPPPVTSPDGLAEAEEFIRLESRPARWPVPEALSAAVESLGAALVARDAASVRGWLADPTLWDEAAQSMLGGARFADHAVVAVARIGGQLLVKIRLDGPTRSATLAARWAEGPAGWRVHALDVARAETARSA
ncbi:MAG TPA: hypothetical protein VJU81_15100 [Methylomirabilota bacterium]|nr:hypothetical protein [Methylomirabilota bacterium]